MDARIPLRDYILRISESGGGSHLQHFGAGDVLEIGKRNEICAATPAEACTWLITLQDSQRRITADAETRLNQIRDRIRLDQNLRAEALALNASLDQVFSESESDVKESVKFTLNILLGSEGLPERIWEALSSFSISKAINDDALSFTADGVIAIKKAGGTRSVGSFVEAGSAVVALSKQLGVDPGVVRTAQQVVSTAQTANRLVSAIASGNPLNAIASIGGMLFGGPDIAEIRHQELLRRFDEVMESQRQIQSTLRDIQFQIASLSDQMKQQHAEVMQQLKEIREALSVQTSILVSGLDTQLASCRSLADSLELASTYDDKSAVLRGNAALLANCKVNLNAILQPTGALDTSGVSASLRLSTVLSGSHNDVLFAITRSLAKFEGLTEASQRARALELFECCGRTFGAVFAKQAMLQEPPENPVPLELVKLPLNDAFLVEVANLVLRLAPYLNLLDSASGGLLNPAIALSPEKARDLAVNADGTRQFLRRLALLTRVARVQRTMLSGTLHNASLTCAVRVRLRKR